MKTETENAIRSIASMDPEITKEELERAMDILHGKPKNDEDLVRILKFKEVTKLMNIHRRTLEYYISQGYLDRVYGRGKRALGISRDSYLRFTTRRAVVHCEPKSAKK